MIVNKLFISRIPKKLASKTPKQPLRKSQRLAEQPKEPGEPSKIIAEEEVEDESVEPLSPSSSEDEVRVIENKNKRERVYKKKTREEGKAIRNARQRATIMGDEFQSRNPNVPFIAVAIQPAYLKRSFLPIPASCKGMHMLSQGKKIKAQVDGKEGCWLLHAPEKGGRRLSCGVSSFLIDNELVEGDVILIELTEDITSIYLDGKVRISRARS